MGLLKFVWIPAIAVVIAFFIDNLPNHPVHVDENGYFGAGKHVKDDPTIREFKIGVGNETIEDLKRRLKASRISHEVLEDSNDFYYGFNANHLKKLRDYWLTKYDWRQFEAILNQFPQFKTQIEGIQVHFIRAKPPKSYKTVKPLLLSHGWPGNVFEFYKFIPILTDPKKHGINYAFEVIAPSIPGYGWSESPKKTGFSQLACARVFRKLMNRLGFDKFYMQGGDWGGIVNMLIAKAWPESVVALHLNMIPIMPGSSIVGTFIDIVGSFFPSVFFSSPTLSKSHNFFTKALNLIAETGYMHIQATKPDTVGTSLNDSPLGLAAYIIEKFSTWTNIDYRAFPDGGLNKKFTNDELLTIVMIYWTNGNIVASQRFYREFFLDKTIKAFEKHYVSIPTGHASAINELYDLCPVEVSSRLFNITHYTEIDMGHFAAFEQPKLLAQSLFKFVSDLE
ncbi:unnamed protein product [Caenorhabditis bovis]|uniref:Epoxide hydrolase n=1 Tax=Caenorhabditis bovis TaxID=2654633 RepID=A0A8S1EFD6_9PELO|nr:unnamed protein product [Caenorhabditis bovis]